MKKETIIWQNKNKAYSLLLHTINIRDDSVNAYLNKMNTFITFPVLNSDFTFLNNVYENTPYSLSQCSNCHNNK